MPNTTPLVFLLPSLTKEKGFYRKTAYLTDMQDEGLMKSVGIDIGTSTTQCVFSSMRLVNTAPAFAVPKMAFQDQQVLYRAPLCLTPLLSANTIDTDKIRAMIQANFHAAGIGPSDIQVGAVIITGETARKNNARAVAEALAGLAGDFVVATAGPHLEAVLAGYGSGASTLSKEHGMLVLNLDIGGGTTNMCLFSRGKPMETGCLNVGGRLLRRDMSTGKILSSSEAVCLVAEEIGIVLRQDETLSDMEIKRIADRMAELLEEAAGFRPRSRLHELLTVEHSLPTSASVSLYTFSGGVAECVYGTPPNPLFEDDMGSALGKALRESRFFSEGRVLQPKEIQHATVIGAGIYSVTVSGSTVAFANAPLPIRNLPVGKIALDSPADIAFLMERIAQQRSMLEEPFAIGFTGWLSPTYSEIQAIAEVLDKALGLDMHCPVILIEHDMAKAIGQALQRRRGMDAPIVCLDGLSLSHGDLIDIGAPLPGGRVLPVIVKTLAFSA